MSFRYFEAPDYYRPVKGDPPAVFLAGGITNCPRWHEHAVNALLASGEQMVVLNPNRKNFPIDDPGAGREQVWWEQDHLLMPDVITMMWFPASDPKLTTQPIALLEFGQVTVTPGRRMLIGADLGYPRVADVALFMDYHRPGQHVFSNLDALLAAVVTEVRHG